MQLFKFVSIWTEIIAEIFKTSIGVAISWPTAVLQCRPPRCFILEIFVFRICPFVSDQPKTHPFHPHPPHIPYRRKEPIHPTSRPLFHTHSNYTPGLTNCPIKWVTNSPPGKGFINDAAQEVLIMKFKRTLPPLYLVTDQWRNRSRLKRRIFAV